MPISQVYCRICKSPVRGDIDKLLAKNIPLREIAVSYLRYFPAVVENNLYQSLLHHKNKKHPPMISSIKLDSLPTQAPVEESSEPEKPLSIDDYFDQILKKGFSPEVMGKLSPAQIIQAQKIIYERSKTKEQNTLLLDTLKSFMSGLVTAEDEERVRQIEGEQSSEGPTNTL
jgi:hypothetical protein